MVTGEEGDFLKVQVDSDLEGYVFREYMKTSVEFNKAVSVEEEKAKAAEEAKRKEDAKRPCRLWRTRRRQMRPRRQRQPPQRPKTTEAPATTAPKKEETKGTDAVTTIAANPENGKDSTVAAPTTAKAPETVDKSKGAGITWRNLHRGGFCYP